MRSEELNIVDDEIKTADTAIFGKVNISEVFEQELEAREAGYCYDAHAYLINVFGGMEPVSWKVLARASGRSEWEFCKVMNNE